MEAWPEELFVVNGIGKGGGLALFWDENINVEILSYSQRHIDTIIRGLDDLPSWRCTFVYGEPRVQDRHLMWELIRSIKNWCGAPWMMMGDFNEAMWSFEHFSARRRAKRQMLDFHEILSHCDLHDLGFIRVPWTYNNKLQGGNNVRVRLDRAVALPSWTDRYADARVAHLTTSRSDYCPLLLLMERRDLGVRKGKP